MAPPRTSRARYQLSPAEHQRIFRDRIAPVEFGQVQSVQTPELHYFAGQPGAGKSSLQAQVVTAIAERSGWPSIMQIVGDDFRAYHPDYARLLDRDDQIAAFYTDLDSGRWVEDSTKLSLHLRSHVALEGTFRRPEVVEQTVTRYEKANFARHLHLLAVHQFISRMRIIGRYLTQIEQEGHGRYTTAQAHDVAYNALPDSLAVVAAAGIFNAITLYRGNGHPLLTINDNTAEAKDKLLTVLSQERTTPYIATDQLLATLNNFQNLARHHERQRCLSDILRLQREMRNAAKAP
jgi:predicted ABC-type ATPase